MQTYIVAWLASALMLGGLMAMATPGFADEPLKINGEVKQGETDGTPLQVIPTNQGVVIVTGKLVKGRPANAVLVQGAQPVEIKVTPLTQHTQVMTLHRAWEEDLASQVRCIQSCP